ncbi:MAG: hypothetical protein DYG86_08930, partial [Chloroflexi bacterium CFX2]|nr:hypothetical protein [Chloroflexi bacterium CFX2]
IPFAYPPFGFYFAWMISSALRVSDLTILRWLPPLVNTLSIIVFYLLASEILVSKPSGALAAGFYALTPGAYGWFVMGGGLTRSFGSIFLLFSVLSVLRTFKVGTARNIALSILYCSLAVLSHPEAGLHTAAICLLLWFFYGRSVRSFWRAILVGAGVLVATSSWWLAVISYHGFGPFLSAMHTGANGIPLWQGLTNLLRGAEVVPFMVILRLIAILWGLWTRQYLLVIWTFLPYLIEPRSAPSVARYPLTMMMALVVTQAIPWFLSILRRKPAEEEIYKNKRVNHVLLGILIYMFIESNLYGFRLVGNSLNVGEREAMNWIEGNTPPEALFLPLTGVPSPETDPFVEWFPAQAKRRSQSTIQGYEWLLADGFFQRYSLLSELQRCDSAECVEEWSQDNALPYDYVVLTANNAKGELGRSFQMNPNYVQVYATQEVMVYEKIR